MSITMSFDSIVFPLVNVILCSTRSETPRKLFKFYIKHNLEFESMFSHRTAPGSETASI